MLEGAALEARRAAVYVYAQRQSACSKCRHGQDRRIVNRCVVTQACGGRQLMQKMIREPTSINEQQTAACQSLYVVYGCGMLLEPRGEASDAHANFSSRRDGRRQSVNLERREGRACTGSAATPSILKKDENEGVSV